MLTKDETVRGLISTSVDLGATRISQRLYNGSQISLMFHEVRSKANEDRLVVSLSLVARLRTVRRSGEVFYTKQIA